MVGANMTRQQAGVSAAFDEWFQGSEWNGPKATLELIRCAQAAWKAALREGGQAGVSAEAVVKLVEKWDKIADSIDDGTHTTECSKRACDFRSRARELEAALATAPPEQAARPTVSGASPVCLDCNKAGLRNCSHFDNCDGVWVYKPDSPQAASDGALSALIAKGKVGWMDSTDFSCELGYALGGNKIFPDAEDCAKNHLCIEIPDAAWPCKAQRVIVFDADELNATLYRPRSKGAGRGAGNGSQTAFRHTHGR